MSPTTAPPAPTASPATRGLPRRLLTILWPLLVFAACAGAFTGPALLRGDALTGSDILLSESPYRSTQRTAHEPGNPLQLDQAEQLPFVLEFWESAREGRFQLWEPDAGGGMPLALAVHTRVLAPWNAVLLVVPGAAGVTLSVAVGLFVGQLGTYWLARRLGLSRPAAVVAGVAYGFSGPVLAFVLRIHEVLLFPALLAVLHGAVHADGRRGRHVLGVTVLTAATLLAGFPGVAVMAMYAAAAWTAYLLLERAAGGARGRVLARAGQVAVSALAAGGGTAAGAALAAPILLPSYAFLDASGSLDRGYPPTHHAGLAQLATAVSGRLFGTFQDGTWWWPDDYYSNPFEANVTIGLVTLGLVAVLALRGLPDDHPASRPLRRFLVPLGLVTLAATYLGGPVIAVLREVPLLGLNGLGRSRFMLPLALALAAGLGLERLVDARRGLRAGNGSRWLRVQLGLVLALVALGLNEVYLTAWPDGRLGEVLAALAVPGATLGIAALAVAAVGRHRVVLAVAVAALVAVELQWGAWGFTPSSPAAALYPRAPAFDAIAEGTSPGGDWRFFGANLNVARPHASSVLDLRDARMAFPAVQSYRDVLEVADPRIWRAGRLKTYVTPELDLGSPALDAASVRYFTAPLEAGPRDVGGPVAGVELGEDAPFGAVGSPPPGIYRSVTVSVDVAPLCRVGWLELLDGAGEVVGRRPVPGSGDRPTFVLPDVEVRGDEPWRVRGTDCTARTGDDDVYWQPPEDGTRLEVTSVEGWVVYERLDAIPRATLADALVRVADPDERLARLGARAPDGPILVEGALGAGGVRASRLPPSALGGGSAEIVSDEPDRVAVATDSDGPGLLVLRDVAAPGWRAAVDGEPADVIVADHAFRGVTVPDGEAEVVFTYLPDGYVLGRTMALAGVVGAGALAALLGLLARRARGRGARPDAHASAAAHSSADDVAVRAPGATGAPVPVPVGIGMSAGHGEYPPPAPARGRRYLAGATGGLVAAGLLGVIARSARHGAPGSVPGRVLRPPDHAGWRAGERAGERAGHRPGDG